LFEYLKNAATLGSVDAKRELALLYETKKDFKESARLYQEAIDLGKKSNQ
jgi:TPR repeat protein